jgi:hypothetical protein
VYSDSNTIYSVTIFVNVGRSIQRNARNGSAQQARLSYRVAEERGCRVNWPLVCVSVASAVMATSLAVPTIIAMLTVLAPTRAGLVRDANPTVRILSPIDFEVLHHSEVQVEYRLSGETSAVSAAILLVNGTEALRTMNRQPSVSLSGLPPGICNLSVRVVGHHGELVADASTLFFISSAAATPNQGDAKEVPPPEHDDEGRWFAIAFGSDDWGWGANSIPVFPSMEELRRARDEGWDPGSWGSASVETRDDIERLFDLIEGLNEGTPAHQRVVLSPYWVVGGPDFRAMAASGCPGAETCAYHERVWSSNDVGPPGAWPFCRGDLRALVRSGFEAGLWHPQYHGRSHFDTRAWVAYLRNDLVSQRYFARGMVFCNDTMLDNNGHPRTLISEHVREHPLPSVSDNDSAQVLAWLEGGVKTFAQFWGYTPVVASMPHHA